MITIYIIVFLFQTHSLKCNIALNTNIDRNKQHSCFIKRMQQLAIQKTRCVFMHNFRVNFNLYNQV